MYIIVIVYFNVLCFLCLYLIYYIFRVFMYPVLFASLQTADEGVRQQQVVVALRSQDPHPVTL